MTYAEVVEDLSRWDGPLFYKHDHKELVPAEPPYYGYQFHIWPAQPQAAAAASAKGSWAKSPQVRFWMDEEKPSLWKRLKNWLNK